MSLFYRIAYWIGVKPWEEMAALPISRQISSLFDREESGRLPPYGTALDLGCGSGIWAVKLAIRGWQVTGIDISARALRTARRRMQEAGVNGRFVQGNLTMLRNAGVGTGFQFLFDFGAIHGLSDAQREAASREISAVAAANATLLILAWIPGSRGPLPRGMSRAEIEDLFPDWKLISDEAADVTNAPAFIKRSRPHFYRLQHC